jgi:hypothetical protein
MPVGETINGDSLYYLRPPMLQFRIDAEFPVWKYLRVFVDTGFGMSLAEKLQLQTKGVVRVDTDGVDANMLWTSEARTTDLSYTAMRVPIDVGVKFVADTGRFLPFAVLGVGFSWQRYSFDNEQMGVSIIDYKSGDGSAIPCRGWPYDCTPYASTGISGKKNDMNLALKPRESAVDYFGLDFIAGVGAEYLITQNVGVKFDVRYSLTYLLNYGDGMTQFVGQKVKDDQTQVNTYADMFPVRQIQHNIEASVGVIVYW